MKIQKIISILMIMALSIFSACSKKQDLTEKVLNITAPSDIKGFDPIMSGDVGSAAQIAKVYEGLLSYHWLKIPFELVPNLAEEMPTVSKDGMTYTFKVRKGVLFQDDMAFPNGKGRELDAHDFVYSIKRLADVKNQAAGWWKSACRTL